MFAKQCGLVFIKYKLIKVALPTRIQKDKKTMLGVSEL